MEMRVWKIEIRGAGVQNWEFENKAQAEQFAAACFWWGGRQYRVFAAFKKVQVEEKVVI